MGDAPFQFSFSVIMVLNFVVPFYFFSISHAGFSWLCFGCLLGSFVESVDNYFICRQYHMFVGWFSSTSATD